MNPLTVIFVLAALAMKINVRAVYRQTSVPKCMDIASIQHC